jgi:hypothetical protein
MSSILAPQGKVTLTLTSTQKVAVASRGTAQVFRQIGYPNYPDQLSKVGTVTNTTSTFGTYTGGATIIIENQSAYPVMYDVGTAPLVTENADISYQGDAATATATATLTVAQVLNGLLVATPAAAVNYTLPTGTLLDAGASLSIGDSVEWTIINLATDVTYIITVVAGTDHTVVGQMACCSNATATGVVHGSSARFKTRKTAANTFVTYRVA